MKLPAHLFRGWPKPDVALVLSNQHTVISCPAAAPGRRRAGWKRRYNFVQLLKEKGWLVAAVDGGDVPQVNGPQSLPNVQGPIKYRYSMDAMKLIGYAACGHRPQRAGHAAGASNYRVAAELTLASYPGGQLR